MGELKRNYEITVQGQYYGAHDTTGTPTVKNYVAKFVLPSQEAALSVICKHLLDPYLRKHYQDFARFRSHKITSVVVNGRPPDAAVLQMSFEDMGVRDLSDFCILKQIFIDPYKHKDLEKCRQAVREEWELRISQAKADQVSGASAENAEVEALLKLNELPPKSETPLINVNEQRIGAALAKAAVDPRPSLSPESITTAAIPADEPLPPASDDDLLA